mmetsp:Transcript_28689/g.39634  ORF Transcript_28689/g.39634 Transcript_28689/m.39634 type:complete len:131 (+) Transcript_28689:141-533(+)|eukprot:CAMPEP_0196570302 /NCGR_PEP_ID=MMETSP1081-20130531/317_1 /TAXON_ID=36882 /ORGANISM="Pyramimonas amylifera, Strain CCMP720" /LENGTH=130 /DNA_ID=CAMNT_0041886657 /DNA_START=104 /DNA_END=496 /DNA_ORIENTATION=+
MASIMSRSATHVVKAQAFNLKAKTQFRGACVIKQQKAQPIRAARFFVNAAADQETVDKVRGIISEQLGTDLDKVAADAKFVDLGADSLDTVEIMMALEEEFEITLDEEGAEKITTVQEAADLIADQVSSS